MRNCFLLFAISAALAASAKADIVAEYTFDGGSFADTANIGNSTVTPISDGPGVPLATDAGFGSPSPHSLQFTFLDVGADLNESLTNGDYYSFTVTPDSGYLANYTQLDFEWFKTSGAGANVTASLFTSLDGFTAGDIVDNQMLAGSGQSGSFFSRSFDLSSLPADLTVPVEFRIYIDDAGATSQSNQFRLDSFQLMGTIAPPPLSPEPGTLILSSASLLLLAFFAWNRKRRSRAAIS